MELVIQLMLAVSLSACVGFKAFVPLLIIGLFARFHYITLAPSFQFLETNHALIVFGLATVIEIAADKIPAVDHVLDAIQSFVKPVAATLLTSSVVTKITDPVMAVVVGIIVGGSIASVVNFGKSSLRVVSTTVSAGVGNPFLSTAEDITSVSGTFLAIFLPVVAFIFTLVLLFIIIKVYTGIRRKRQTEACT